MAKIDHQVLSEIPQFRGRPVTVEANASSAWADRYQVEVDDDDGPCESYFMKVSRGDSGRDALKGEFESTAEMHAVVGDFTPKPIAWGTFGSLPDAHYYICKFHDLQQRMPSAQKLCSEVAALHKKSKSPNGKFGFHITTYNGNVPQDNDYADTWEEFFTRGFQHMLDLAVERGGPWEEMEKLRPDVITKVIPRLLRPMETGGRSVKPVLVHGDLWWGNIAVDTQRSKPLIYDPASFYAHNEYEIGNWRPGRNGFSKEHFDAYGSLIPPSEPAMDFDDRNALYAMRFNLHAASMFPNMTSYRQFVIDEMERLTAKYPGGYEAYEEGQE